MRYRYILLLVIIFFHSTCLCAEEAIWQIGRENNNNSEFELPGIDAPMIAEYRVPSGWADNVDDTYYIWEGFYKYICTPGSGLPPQEIRIQFDYSGDYTSPLLYIRASAQVNNTQRLAVYMNDQLIDPTFAVKAAFNTFQFPLYAISAGTRDENIITVKNVPLAGTGPIVFDYLRLINGDSDGDGALDIDEPEGDMDGDTIENRLDPDTATIIINDDEYLLFDLQEDEEGTTYFNDLKILDSEDIANSAPPDSFFRYGLFKIDVQGLTGEEEYPLTICYPNKIYAFASFFFYSENEGFKKSELSINDRCLSVGIKPEKGQQFIIGGLSYPRDPQKGINEEGCFINSIF